jgi:hypothetical protein
VEALRVIHSVSASLRQQFFRKGTLIKLIAIDLDGTAVHHDQTISPRVCAAVRAAQARGVHVAIATGRGPVSARPFADLLGIRGPILCTQGALLHHAGTGVDLHRVNLSDDTACMLAEWDAAERKAHTLLYVRDHIHVRALRHSAAYYARWFVPNPPTVMPNLCDALANGPADKVLYVVEPERADEILAELIALVGPRGNPARTHEFFVEVNPPGADKGTGLALLAAHLGVSQAEVMAIGDQGNDLPMLRWAGLPVAMGNGIAEAKALARWVAPSVDDDGVAAAIEKFVLR